MKHTIYFTIPSKDGVVRLNTGGFRILERTAGYMSSIGFLCDDFARSISIRISINKLKMGLRVTEKD